MYLFWPSCWSTDKKYVEEDGAVRWGAELRVVFSFVAVLAKPTLKAIHVFWTFIQLAQKAHVHILGVFAGCDPMG